MTKIDMESLADVIFNLRWQSDAAQHTDCYQAVNVNFWRDDLPRDLLAALMGREPGERVEFQTDGDRPIADFNPRELFDLKRSQFGDPSPAHGEKQPRVGRFYPRGLLNGVAGVFRANVQPFRCVAVNNGNLSVDFNHPLAGKTLGLSCLIGDVKRKKDERGGTSTNWLETLTEGPGMQARWRRQRTDFSGDQAFSRRDEAPDSQFYDKPRLVQHLDDTALGIVRDTYGRFLREGMQVLDLMSSWQSHVPSGVTLDRLAGLGLNSAELRKNPQLSDFTVQDLNQDPTLPYPDGSFQAVLNTASVEYLTQPVTIFNEVARVLRPGGVFVVTFSNRWFPPKAIRLWEGLHEFERMGLVLEYFMQSAEFDDLHTYSMRGLPRPFEDKYFPELLYSDPVYAVWGQKQ
jgi:SAM-dependent methyltransferase/FKBP-type peptidyl-prolyl cis-trans isomerase 2